MVIPPLLLQFLVSLTAILALYGLARMLGFGSKPKLVDEASVRFKAGEVEDGFVAERIAISKPGDTALARDANAQIMVIKRHGNRFAGRILSDQTLVREEVDAIIVDCGDTQFGSVRLSLDQPSIWVDAINRL
ncbi:MAG: hypothetical protein ABJK59_15570 [Erythrobacter sp.]|uniref:hypothetical protein n=1 Tax=Erythrobacter sp. TaxID=1042 RepID=UPI003298302D